jgi:hypothetical protein
VRGSYATEPGLLCANRSGRGCNPPTKSLVSSTVCPEDREPLMERRAARFDALRNPLHRLGIRRQRWVGENQGEVDVADQGIESPLGKAAEGVGGKQSPAKSLAVRAHGLSENRPPFLGRGLAHVPWVLTPPLSHS